MVPDFNSSLTATRDISARLQRDFPNKLSPAHGTVVSRHLNQARFSDGTSSVFHMPAGCDSKQVGRVPPASGGAETNEHPPVTRSHRPARRTQWHRVTRPPSPSAVLLIQPIVSEQIKPNQHLPPCYAGQTERDAAEIYTSSPKWGRDREISASIPTSSELYREMKLAEHLPWG